jgi:hypothetical protein
MPESPQVMNSTQRAVTAITGFCAALALVTAGCTRAGFVAPAGPGVPIADAGTSWQQASSGCGDVHAFVAGARASGKVGSQRVWPVSLEIAVTNTDSIYIGATAAGNSVFVLAGTAGGATLWLRHDHRVVTATPAQIMEAVVGVAITPGQLLGMLSGCVARTVDVPAAVQHKDLIELRAPEGRLFLSQVAGQWQVRAWMTNAFSVELSRRAGGSRMTSGFDPQPTRRSMRPCI